MERIRRCGNGRGREEGSFLLILMIGVAVAAIALTAAVQAWTTIWRRDSEEELIFRGNQYVLAIMAYQKEHGGQYPLRLEDLYKQGPRRLRYIRKLYKDPIVKEGKWGLLYLAPGGQTIYDPRAAQKAAQKAQGSGWGSDDDDAPAGGGMPGAVRLNPDPLGTGVPGTGGPMAGAPKGPMPPVPPGPLQGLGGEEGESVSEPPLGWPIIGVVSLAHGKIAEKTFKIYKGHETVDEWQFTVLDQRLEQPQMPGTPGSPAPFLGAGPGFGGHPLFGGVGQGPRPRPGPGKGGGFGGGGAGQSGGKQQNPNKPGTQP